MTKQELNNLIDQVNSGRATEEELRLYAFYLNHITSGETEWDTELLGEEEIVKAELLRRVETLRIRGIAKKVKFWPRISRSKFGTRRVWLASAAAVAVITLGVWLYYASSISDRHPELVSGSPLANDIAPGKNTATITFDNGEVVDLNEEELDISSATVEPLKEGSEVAPETTQFLASRIAKSKTVVLSTPRGGQYQVVLPDGTKVWLNADSKISFPSQFTGKVRKVLTEGEVYFEVAKNKAKPFVVQTDQQEVTVLGTHFNISAYPDEGSTKTTLLEGSVKVSPLAIGGRLDTKYSILNTILKPGQQASLKGEALQVKEVNLEEAVAWKEGYFRFYEVDLETFMTTIARWYDIDVFYEGGIGQYRDLAFGGSVSRSKKISEVLKILAQTGKVRYKIEGKKVTITK